jgi:hypothetical protein
MFVSRHQNVGQNKNLLVANEPFENVAYSRIWEQQQQLKIAFRNKLRAD